MIVSGFETTYSRFGKNANPDVITEKQGYRSSPDCAAAVKVQPVFQPAPISNHDLSNRRLSREKRPSLLSGLIYIYFFNAINSLK